MCLPPRLSKTKMTAQRGRRGVCETDENGLNVISFELTVGSNVERADWCHLYLCD